MIGADHDLADILKVDGHPISNDRLYLPDTPLEVIRMAHTHTWGEFRRHKAKLTPLSGLRLAYRGDRNIESPLLVADLATCRG